MPNNDYLNLKELHHHGIKGQKWGVRRFQNEDGTLTDSGKARYDSEGNKYKNPETMSDKELMGVNKRLSAESQYRQLTGTTQPSKAFTKDNAIKIGATFVATALSTALIRKYKTGEFITSKTVDGKTVKDVGGAISTALLAGGIGALMAGAGALGGSANPMSKKEESGD